MKAHFLRQWGSPIDGQSTYSYQFDGTMMKKAPPELWWRRRYRLNGHPHPICHHAPEGAETSGKISN
ncbi:hypothetical protein [Microbulbifer thermotolerans]|uniref:YD repeat-containing protein n=1 Tax=Microbulbifer thermotolerans TaxID=252514 RepID=A0AB35I0Q3_MICTH|nr:hypothetical protein [Microbulbifer thermotolerans]MCX2803379.1 hypothetical protein [Microbulbifer thermotolerans]MCX2833182.1 hypothetical protein [Microbulbifer thermotolerans]WKT59328.1 hypothetical protein Q2E61_10420 [Microbulbifer thermotolerans]